jgi:DNA transposition AAA+ family ATPase
MMGIVGYPGAGKTTALRDFSDRTHKSYYVRVTASMTAKDFYSNLLNAMGVEGKYQGTSLHALINDISFRLNYSNLRKLIIIDEAGKLKPKFLEYLHEIRDNTANTTGIIIAGPEYFKTNLKKWKDRGVIGVPELYRRINYWEELDLPTKSEIKAFCKQKKVDDDDLVLTIARTCENYSDVLNAIEDYILRKNSQDK